MRKTTIAVFFLTISMTLSACGQQTADIKGLNEEINELKDEMEELKEENNELKAKIYDYENGKAKRWTGLGNCIFASDIDFIIQVLICLSSNENDKVMSSYKRNNSLLYNQVSSSENCSLNFTKRLFLPKLG